MGYNVHYLDDDVVNVAGFDFSPYDAIVIGEASSSSKITNMVINYGYPLPILNLKGMVMRYDKWNWVQNPDPGTYTNKNDYPGFIVNRCLIPFLPRQILTQVLDEPRDGTVRWRRVNTPSSTSNGYHPNGGWSEASRARTTSCR